MPMEIAQMMRGTARRAAFVMGQDLPFWYPINVVLTANQGGVRNVIQIDNDGEFEWRSCIASSTGLFSFTLTNNFIKPPLLPTPINGENTAGTAQQPGFLPVPWRLKRTTILQAEFHDPSGAGNTIQFCLTGYKKLPQNYGVFIPNVLRYRTALSHADLPTIAELAQVSA